MITLFFHTHRTFVFAAEGLDGVLTQNNGAVILISLGVAIMAALLIYSARSRMSGDAEAHRMPRHNALSQESGDHEHIDEAFMQRQIDQLREEVARIDQKVGHLEQLLAEADERIAMLRALNHSIAESKPMPSEEPADPLTRSVYELADAGRSPVEIARKLDEQVGKVDLILALRGR